MKRISKGVISCILILAIFVGIALTPLTAYADSNDRISKFIQLAKDGQVTDGNVSDMTEDQLRFLGVYLSNFYIPFGTEIGTSGGEMSETTKKDMVETLQQKFAFSEELATSIVEIIFGYTRSSLQDLSVYVSEGYQDGNYIKVDIAPNYYNFLRLMEGRADDVFHKYAHWRENKNADNGEMLYEIAKWTYGVDSSESGYNSLSEGKKKNCEAIDGIIRNKYKYFYFAYGDGGQITPVADGVLDFSGRDANDKLGILYKDKSSRGISKYSASQVAFLKCLEASNIEKGYGYSYLDFSVNDEFDGDSIDNLTNEDCMKMSILGSTMAVDCFGDIITMGANHQVVIIPGCINPYTWRPVDSDGNDIDSEQAGKYYNIANAISMTQAKVSSEDSGAVNEFIRSTSTSNSSVQGVIQFVPNFGVLNKNLDNIKQNWSLANDADGDYAISGIRHMRGTTKYEFNTTFWVFSADDDSRDFMIKAQNGFTEAYPNDLTYYYGASNKDVNSNKVSSSTVTFDCVVPRSRYKDGMYYGVDMSNSVNLLTKMIFIDNLGVYQNADGTSKDFSAINVAGFVDKDGKTGGSSNVTFGNHSFGNLYNDIQSGKLSVPYDASEQALCALYVTYCWAGLYDSSSKKDTIGRLGYRMNTEGLPDMNNSPIIFDGLNSIDAELNAIKDWVYYLLHPTEGFDYVRILLTNTINHLLLGWHTDMVGTNGTGVTVGVTKYRSNMGYVTMPDLSEIQWTNSLISFYNDCIPFLIIAFIVLMLFAYITKIMSFQHALIGVLLFSICALLPVNLINASVGYSNRITQNIYGDKFTYWALVQQESYAKVIDEAANGSETNTYENYLRTLYSANEAVYTNQGNESILIKWQAPKKMASLVLTENDAESVSGLSETGLRMLSGMLNNTYSGESYVDDEDSVYMYRSYLDISNFSRYIYRGIDDGTVKSYSSLSSTDTSNWKSFRDGNNQMIIPISQFSSDYKDYIQSGYTDGTNFNTESNYSDQFYLTVPISSNIISDVLVDYGKIKEYKDTSDLIPINSDVFNFGIPQFTNDTAEFDAETFTSTGMITDASRKHDLETYLHNYSEEDIVGLAAYALYSENPYYYFSWKLYADGLDANDSNSGSTGFKNLLLGQTEGKYFYNVEGNGGLKDFMNMRGLFTYIIPYMRQCNDMVREWDDIYGIFVYEGVPTEEGHWDEVKDDPELKAKYWHNLNVTRLYDIYCPWVDVMYDCSYSKAETINVLGSKYVVEDPINPNSYPEERPMIFSETEMEDYGLTEADLTKVEKLILTCNEQYQERMFELLNYYNFSDVTLNSAAAMNCAFVFNNTFSENGVFSENHNIYPQSFDLANFSYDAFLRLALSTSTGESLLDDSAVESGGLTSTGKSSGDFYERLVNRSSVFTVIVMLVLDVVSIYVIPAMRIFFLIVIFLVIIFILLVSAFRVEDNMKFSKKVATQFLAPLGLFFLTTIGFAWGISLFLGVGNDSVTNSNPLHISIGDPTMLMIIFLVLDIILILLYWKILKGALHSVRHQAKLAGNFLSGLGGVAVGFVAGAVASGMHNAQDMGGKISNAYYRRRQHKLDKQRNDSLDRIADKEPTPAQDGTGVENSRANERGSSRNNSSEDYRDPQTNNRDNRIDTDNRNDDAYNDSNERKEKQENIDKKASKGSDGMKGKDKSSKSKDTESAKDTHSSEDSDKGRVRNRQTDRSSTPRRSNEGKKERKEKQSKIDDKASKGSDKGSNKE